MLYLDPDEPYNINCYISDLTENQKQHFMDMFIKIEEVPEDEIEKIEGHHYKYFFDATYDETDKIEDYLLSEGFKSVGPGSKKTYLN